MAQTRAISRVCRSAFAFVVVLIDSDLSTTPAEEIAEDVTETKHKPGKYNQEDMVNSELQEAAHRKHVVAQW
jgi:hypothetical protein